MLLVDKLSFFVIAQTYLSERFKNVRTELILLVVQVSYLNHGKVGSCLGGRYPGITKGTSKSSDPFYVNNSYAFLRAHFASHDHEICPQRVARSMNLIVQ